ncbi:MAG: hypothetical protein IIZ92_15590 [Aquincola sp.]|nr:hypothetical protein [Aquincola sp.]
MNLSTLSQLPAEPAPILGKSLRQQREEREAAERAAKPSGPPPMTSAPAGYEVTAQGGLRRVGQPSVIPETKGRALKAGADMAAGPDQTVFVTITGDGQRIVHTDRDDGPCGVVPSVLDVEYAFINAKAKLYMRHDAVARAPGLGESYDCIVGDIPADRRADVIKALNELGN